MFRKLHLYSLKIAKDDKAFLDNEKETYFQLNSSVNILYRWFEKNMNPFASVLHPYD